MILLSASKVWLWVQHDGGIWSFLTWTKNHESLHRHPELSLEVVEVETLLILQENLFDLLLELGDPVSRWIFSVPDLHQQILFVHLRLEIWFFLLGVKYYFLCIESFCVDFRCVHLLQLLNVCNHYITLPNSPRVQSVSKEYSRQYFLSKFMDSWLVLRRDRVIFNQSTKRDNWSIERFSKASFIWCLPIRQEILNISQIDKTFHGVCPPFFIQTWLQQYRRRTFFHSAHFSLSNPICLWSVWCWRIMIPRKIFTGSAEFQGIVSVNDFRLPIRLQELLQAPFGFVRSFVLHGYDWTHWVAKSCTTTAYRWLFRDSHPSLRTLWSAVIESPKFSARGSTLPTRLLHGALVILVLWQISQFRSFEKWV